MFIVEVEDKWKIVWMLHIQKIIRLKNEGEGKGMNIWPTAAA